MMFVIWVWLKRVVFAWSLLASFDWPQGTATWNRAWRLAVECARDYEGMLFGSL